MLVCHASEKGQLYLIAACHVSLTTSRLALLSVHNESRHTRCHTFPPAHIALGRHHLHPVRTGLGRQWCCGWAPGAAPGREQPHQAAPHVTGTCTSWPVLGLALFSASRCFMTQCGKDLPSASARQCCLRAERL